MPDLLRATMSRFSSRFRSRLPRSTTCSSFGVGSPCENNEASFSCHTITRASTGKEVNELPHAGEVGRAADGGKESARMRFSSVEID